MIVTVVNMKGGVGKTTSAMALAEAATRDGMKATVFDADPQGTATNWGDIVEDAGDDLGFAVEPCNLAIVNRIQKRFQGTTDTWAFIDCPPYGKVTDAARDISDFVVIPMKASAPDLTMAVNCARVAEEKGIDYSVLITEAEPHVNNYKDAVALLEENEINLFGNPIRKREKIRSWPNNLFSRDLFGYDTIYNSIKKVVLNG
jgi:chromosome partitioning protein